MVNVLNFEEHSRKYKFNHQIESILTKQNNLYEFFQEDDLGVAYLHHFRVYIYIFFSYIPKGESTVLPDLDHSLKGVRTQKRTSNGEWVVDGIVKLNKEIALETLPLIFSSNKKDGWLKHFKHTVIHNATHKKSL